MNLEIKERNKYKKILKNYNIIKATIREIDLEIEYLKNNNELSQDKEKILIINKKRKKHTTRRTKKEVPPYRSEKNEGILKLKK